MLNQVQKTVCMLLIWASISLPALADSFDVHITGTIMPVACTPALAGGGTVDYGSIKPDALQKDAFTVLEEKQLDFVITCSAPTKLAVAVTSQRGASAVMADGATLRIVSTGGAVNTLFEGTNSGAFGLGMEGASGMGGYGLRLVTDTVNADGKPVDSIQSNGNTTAWAKSTAGSLISDMGTVRYTSWAAQGTTAPLAFTTLAGKMGIQAYLNKASMLELTSQLTFDGLSSLELVYL